MSIKRYSTNASKAWFFHFRVTNVDPATLVPRALIDERSTEIRPSMELEGETRIRVVKDVKDNIVVNRFVGFSNEASVQSFGQE